MQPNEITLTVDEANDGSTTADVDHDYRRVKLNGNGSSYIHTEDHAIDSRDLLAFLASESPPRDNFRGVSRISFKFTKDIVVLGSDGVANITSPIITEVKMSIPKGATAAEVLLERQKAVALLDYDVVMDPLYQYQEV